MSATRVYTYSDAIEALADFARGEGIGASQATLRRAVLEAYDEIATAHQWPFQFANERITLYALEEIDDVAFDLTGGTYERQLTITGTKTWPTWAKDAAVRLNSPPLLCDIDTRESDTVVTLSRSMCPVADITSTSAKVFPRWYRLPNDCLGIMQPQQEDAWRLGIEIDAQQMDELQKYRDEVGQIRYYSFGAPQDLFGAKGIYVHPFSDTTESLDVPIRRAPRPLRYSGRENTESVGTIAVTAGSATVTGTSTAFALAMVGSILRISGTSATPTGLEGTNPYVEQRVIHTVASTTSLTLDAGVSASYSPVGYVISDPIDFDAAVYWALLACAAKCLARRMRFKDTPRVNQDYEEALREAKGRCHHRMQRRVAGVYLGPVDRLTYSSNRTRVD